MSDKLSKEEYQAQIEQIVAQLRDAGVSRTRCYLFQKFCAEAYEMDSDNSYYLLGKRERGSNFIDKSPADLLDDMLSFFFDEFWKPNQLFDIYNKKRDNVDHPDLS